MATTETVPGFLPTIVMMQLVLTVTDPL